MSWCHHSPILFLVKFLQIEPSLQNVVESSPRGENDEMLNEEIVFLDSDEDREVKQKMEVEEDVTKNTDTDHQPSEEAVSLDKENNPKEEQAEDIMVEYNHADYADLVGPMKTPAATAPVPPRPAPPLPPNKVIQGTFQSSTMKKIPKKPGSLPPFALFSQEKRAELQQEDPDIGFGDLGRKLGEMWHALQVNNLVTCILILKFFPTLS